MARPISALNAAARSPRLARHLRPPRPQIGSRPFCSDIPHLNHRSGNNLPGIFFQLSRVWLSIKSKGRHGQSHPFFGSVISPALVLLGEISGADVHGFHEGIVAGRGIAPSAMPSMRNPPCTT